MPSFIVRRKKSISHSYVTFSDDTADAVFDVRSHSLLVFKETNEPETALGPKLSLLVV